MFDYEKFEKDLVAAMEKKLREWAEENDDIYILSLDLSRGMESVGMYANTRNTWRNSLKRSRMISGITSTVRKSGSCVRCWTGFLTRCALL